MEKRRTPAGKGYEFPHLNVVLLDKTLRVPLNEWSFVQYDSKPIETAEQRSWGRVSTAEHRVFRVTVVRVTTPNTN